MVLNQGGYKYKTEAGLLDALVEYPLLAALAQEGLHAFYARRWGAQLAVAFELVHVLPEDVAGAQGADQVVKLRLLVVFTEPRTQ